MLVENFKRASSARVFINWCRLDQQLVLTMLKANRLIAPLHDSQDCRETPQMWKALPDINSNGLGGRRLLL